jgi:TonB family protein
VPIRNGVSNAHDEFRWAKESRDLPMKLFELMYSKHEGSVDLTIAEDFSKHRANVIQQAKSAPVGIRWVLIPEPRVPWRSMSAGVGLQILIGVCFAVVSILLPETFAPVRQYLTTTLANPDGVDRSVPDHQRLAPKRSHQIVQTLPPALEEPVPAPKIGPAMPKTLLASPVRSARRNPAVPDPAEVVTAVVSPPPLVAPSLSIPNLQKPREEVQTGAFAGHDGVEHGDSSAGLNRGRGGVASIDFSNGISGGTSGGTGNRAGVRQSSFDEHAVSIIAKPKAAVSSPKMTPVEIISKPKPVYSNEARAKKIEGEVRLQVVFTAEGEVTIQRVVQGLGYGLDENAEVAAREIRFKPAQRDRQAVDSTAIVHIVFELAS